jgi:hypothetical protein
MPDKPNILVRYLDKACMIMAAQTTLAALAGQD